MFKGKLIISGNNAKTIKGDGSEVETAIMYLAPHKASGSGNVCAMAEKAGCIAGCLNSAGRGAFSNVQLARVNKTKRYFADRAEFMAGLVKDCAAFVRYCARRGIKPAVRLNGTSDIQFEVAHPCYRDGIRFNSIFEAFPEIQYYDYTKIYKRAYRSLPANYSLTLSYSAANPAYAAEIVKAAADTGLNVAVVYRSKEMRDAAILDGNNGTGINNPVIDGDRDDLRFLDPAGSIVGLYAKGSKAKRDRSGFVVDVEAVSLELAA